MEYINIGRIITTHGIKGEIKIKSNFKYKDKVFVVGNHLFIGSNKNKHEIISYRPHQEYDMVILSDINSIDKVIPLKNELIYFDKSKIILKDEYLNEDLINLACYFEDKLIGNIKNITDEGKGNEIIRIENENKKEILIPKNNNFIEEINLENKTIIFKNIGGLL